MCMVSLETVNIVIGSLVIVIEIIILYRLRKHRMELDQHTKNLERNVDELEDYSHWMQDKMRKLMEETEEIYQRTCKDVVEKHVKE